MQVHSGKLPLVTLAYVFWPWPVAGQDRAAYEDRLRAFQRTLAATGLPTAAGVHSLALERGPWAPAAPFPYEDWYLVDDWEALGRLNERAVTGRPRTPHDDVARAAADGAGGVYRIVRSGSAQWADARHAAWIAKPRDVAYERFLADLECTGDVTVCRRQMVLGPAPEFALLSHAPIDAPAEAIRTSPRGLWSALFSAAVDFEPDATDALRQTRPPAPTSAGTRRVLPADARARDWMLPTATRSAASATVALPPCRWRPLESADDWRITGASDPRGWRRRHQRPAESLSAATAACAMRSLARGARRR